MFRVPVVLVLFIASAQIFASTLSTRIIGGRETNIRECPYQASIQSKGRHICGGSIIAQNVVLTAAHCLTATTPETLRVVAGRTRFTDDGGISVSVEDVFIYPDYSSITLKHNIAFLVLSERMQWTDDVQPIQMSLSLEDNQNGVEAIFSGWGSMYQHGPPAEILRSVKVIVESSEECSKRYSTKISSYDICAIDFEYGMGGCQGDHGGPLVANGKLIGTMAWIEACADNERPAVFTKIYAYRSWIESLRRYVSI